ncbi:MAG: TraR/DksA family transcriptional regulator [Candidatus Kaelpia aquatica]|nr:TraR/DksA family transcriptional regulator [Candidatus Kaelpia aquatica]
MNKKLNKQELEKIKKVLMDLKKKISLEIRHLTEDSIFKSQQDVSGEISNYTYHMADMATDSFDREFSYALANNEQELVYLIGEALSRIDSGEYGICELCENNIKKSRLNAIPYAKHCLECQIEEEKRVQREKE